PSSEICPLGAVVELVQKRQKTFVVDHAVQYPACIIVNVIVDALSHKASRCNHSKQRLSSGCHRLPHDIVQVTVLNGMQLVNDNAMAVETIQAIGFTC